MSSPPFGATLAGVPTVTAPVARLLAGREQSDLGRAVHE